MGGTKNENESRNFENDEGLAIALFHSRGKHRSFPTLRFRLREPIVIWTKNESTKKNEYYDSFICSHRTCYRMARSFYEVILSHAKKKLLTNVFRESVPPFLAFSVSF